MKTTVILFSPLPCTWHSLSVCKQLSFPLTQPAWHCQCVLAHATSGRSETKTKSSKKEGLQPVSGCSALVLMAWARHSCDHSVDFSLLLISTLLYCTSSCCCIKVFWTLWANTAFLSSQMSSKGVRTARYFKGRYKTSLVVTHWITWFQRGFLLTSHNCKWFMPRKARIHPFSTEEKERQSQTYLHYPRNVHWELLVLQLQSKIWGAFVA